MQSKVYRAHEALLDELDKYGYIRDESAKVTPPPTSTTTETDSTNEEAKEPLYYISVYFLLFLVLFVQ